MSTAIDRPSLLASRLSGRRIQAAGVAAIIGFLLFWHVRVTGHLSLLAFVTLLLFAFVCLAYGRAFGVATASLLKHKGGLCFQFLSGFLVFNTLLFFISLLSPYGMLPNVGMLALGALALTVFVARQQPDAADDGSEALPGLLCILVAGLAATLWCSDSQAPLLVQGQTAIYQTWQDSFFHVREISTFAQAHGAGTIDHIRMAEVPAQIYHYASYLSAAAVSALAETPAIDVYASFQLPLGIFLVGLAAFSLIASIWGGWPALAAAVAVLLLPDAYQQGFANRYLSYNFLSQVNLGMLYGVACAALAWIFILEGCRRGKLAAILVGYLFLGLCLFYKAHIFVANAFLILLYPCLFFHGIRRRWRLLIGIVLVGIFVAVVGVSQTTDRVPVLRLDGSGIGHYLLILLRDFDEGYLKSFFTQVFTVEQHSKPVELLYACAMLLLSTFGLWVAAMLPVFAALRAKAAPVIRFFPAFIVANYLVMAIGLALDTHGVGTPDELMNRPLVWANFIVVTWTAGGAYFLVFGGGLPRSWKVRSGLAVSLCFVLAWPLFLGNNLQTFPAWQGYAKYEDFNAVPLCLVKAARFIRDNSHPDDLIQGSKNDPRYVLTALAERQLFAGESIFGTPRKELQKRLDGLVGFRAMSDVAALESYADSHNISWYLLHPDTHVSWPTSFLKEAVFDCDGYRVYRFGK